MVQTGLFKNSVSVWQNGHNGTQAEAAARPAHDARQHVVAGFHHMNRWNRLFVVFAICWIVVAPFLLMAEANKPVEQMFSLCSDAVYQLYGSSNSPSPDMEIYRAEVANCVRAYGRDYTSLPKLLWRLDVVGWGFIVIPLALLWIISWGVGRVINRLVARFRR